MQWLFYRIIACWREILWSSSTGRVLRVAIRSHRHYAVHYHGSWDGLGIFFRAYKAYWNEWRHCLLLGFPLSFSCIGVYSYRRHILCPAWLCGGDPYTLTRCHLKMWRIRVPKIAWAQDEFIHQDTTKTVGCRGPRCLNVKTSEDGIGRGPNNVKTRSNKN